MSDLDDKLRGILGREPADSSLAIKYADKTIARIKQAFADEGYLSPEQAKEVQELVNQITDVAHKAMVLPTIQPVIYNKRQQTAQNLMTGQEWLARFEKELDNEWLNHLDIQHKETILEAARRAAGLSDE